MLNEIFKRLQRVSCQVRFCYSMSDEKLSIFRVFWSVKLWIRDYGPVQLEKKKGIWLLLSWMPSWLSLSTGSDAPSCWEPSIGSNHPVAGAPSGASSVQCSPSCQISNIKSFSRMSFHVEIFGIKWYFLSQDEIKSTQLLKNTRYYLL